MEKRDKKIRALIMGIIWCLVLVIYIFRLINLQIIHGEDNLNSATSKSYKTQTTSAVRGEILDADGNPIVTNRMGLAVTVDKAYMGDEDENRIYMCLISILKENEIEIKDGLPITDEIPYEWESGKESAKSKLLKTLELSENTTAAVAITKLYEKYDFSDFSEPDRRLIAGFRYEMELRDFAVGTPFVAATDIPVEVASKIKELRYTMPGVDISVESVRIITDGTFAPHVIGRTGLIPADEAEKYTELGYPLNATIGKEGCEKAFEQYLRGTEGTTMVELNSTGKVVAVHSGEETVPGNTVWLTLRSKLQKVAQESLEKTIKSLKGTSAGSVVAMNPNTGAIYAMATYPSYDSTTYSTNFSDLINDKDNPLLNRAVSGTYSPGSTFKIATALAGLENGAITTNEKILDKGRYTFYDDYQPKCWIYDSYGTTHGLINVSDAIKTSCNYFFFEVGRRVGIDKLNNVCKRLGLGEYTGIEIGESKGILASSSYKETVVGEQWYGGDTLQAAIGQSYNLFTPLQICNYICTVVNGGTRYKAHLLEKVTDYNQTTVVEEYKPEVLGTIDITDSEYKAVMEGMRSVTEEGGTAARVFAKYPIAVGGKTGTASVSSGVANGVFVGFAPYNNPEIVVAVVVEHAGSGNSIAPIAKELFDAYFKMGIYADDYKAPEESSSSSVQKDSSSQKKPTQNSESQPTAPVDSASSSSSETLEPEVSESSSGEPESHSEETTEETESS